RAGRADLAEIELVDAGTALVVDERDGDLLRPGRDAQAEAARVAHGNGRAVERDVDRRPVAPDHRAGRVVPAFAGPGRADRELVDGVEREDVLDDEPAARAERKPVDVAALRGSRRGRVADLAVPHRHVADGTAADL